MDGGFWYSDFCFLWEVCFITEIRSTEKTGFGTGRYWIPAAGWLLSLYERNGMGIREYYGWYLGYIFVPFLLVIQSFSQYGNRGDGKKK